MFDYLVGSSKIIRRSLYSVQSLMVAGKRFAAAGFLTYTIYCAIELYIILNFSLEYLDRRKVYQRSLWTKFEELPFMMASHCF